jgi:peptide deformylase
MFEVVLYGDPVLRRMCTPVSHFDASLKKFAAAMTETMIAADGLGLAAPQVGRSVRMVVIDESRGEKPAIVLVNPEIYWSSDITEEREEGCLSLPDLNIKVTRPASVSVKAQDVDGNEIKIEKAEGMLARAIQHETDHLNGKMIIDYASPLQRQLLNSKLKKMAKAAKESQTA